MIKIAFTFLWLIATVAVVAVITLPISLQAHLIAGSVVVAAMMTLKLVRPWGVWRLISLALGTSIVLRYVYWRTTSTLPPINQPENFIPGFLLYSAEMYSVVMLALSLFAVAMPLKKRETPPPIGKEPPTVDVFVPTYNEELSLLAMTLAAAKAMDYPQDRFTVWLLDDGGTDQKCNSENVEEAVVALQRRHELQNLCEKLGVRYLTRERNISAKAGNLNNGLQHSTGELVAVFDADHAPARDFLTETVGYFGQDPRLFLVQTPHFFLNPDPVERNLRTFDRMPSENEMFYGVIQRGLDKWNASFFCGSAAVLRREALFETKGFSGLSITEDCETALELHSRGWNSVYVDKPLIAGLQPESFASFIGQRTRWAQGMMQILRFQFPLFKRGLSLPQRLCYMSSTMFWMFPISRWIFLISPLFYLVFSLEMFTASGTEFLAYTSTYMIVNLIMQNYLYGRYRWPWISELYEFVQSIYLMPALISVILNPRRPTFKVTAKNENLDRSHISELGTPFFIIFAVLLAGVIMTAYRIATEPYEADVAIVVGGWNLLNLLMAGCALGVVSERVKYQRTHRVTVSRRCEIQVGEKWMPATIENVSVGGAAIHIVGAMPSNLERGWQAAIRFKPHADFEYDSLPITVADVAKDGVGAMVRGGFAATEPSHYRLIADLMYANSKQWTDFQRARRVNIGLIRGTLWFFSVAIYQTGRGLGYLLQPSRTIGSKAEAPAPMLAKADVP